MTNSFLKTSGAIQAQPWQMLHTLMQLLVLYPSSQRESQVRIKNQEYWPIPVVTENFFLSFLHLHCAFISKSPLISPLTATCEQWHHFNGKQLKNILSDSFSLMTQSVLFRAVGPS